MFYRLHRPAVKEQVESLGAYFLEVPGMKLEEGAGGYAKVMSKEFIDAEMNLFAQQCKEVDVIITTALIPGKPAPKLITKEMVSTMKPGSVIIDLAAEMGGNCEETVPNKNYVNDNGVRIVGYTDLPSRLPQQSSTLLANNVTRLLQSMMEEKEGVRESDMASDVVVMNVCMVSVCLGYQLLYMYSSFSSDAFLLLAGRMNRWADTYMDAYSLSLCESVYVNRLSHCFGP